MSYGVYFVRILEKIDHVINAQHYDWQYGLWAEWCQAIT